MTNNNQYSYEQPQYRQLQSYNTQGNYGMNNKNDYNNIQNSLGLLKSKMNSNSYNTFGQKTNYDSYSQQNNDMNGLKMKTTDFSNNQKMQSYEPRNETVKFPQAHNSNKNRSLGKNQMNEYQPSIQSNPQNNFTVKKTYEEYLKEQNNNIQKTFEVKETKAVPYQRDNLPPRKIQQPQQIPQQQQQQQYNQVYQKPQQSFKIQEAKPKKIMSNKPQKFSKQKSLELDEKPAVATGQVEEPEFIQQELIMCPEGCGKKFGREALQKHQKICYQVFQKKRKKFNTKDQRLGEVKKELKEASRNNNNGFFGNKKQKEEKKTNWKKQSEQLRNGLKNNNAADDYEDDYQQCPHCKRTFNDTAFVKHVKSCKERSKKMGFRG